MPPRPIVILGPTASGKTELAAALAERFAGQVLGADSMQVYRHMDVGTAKPPAALRRRVVHHLIDIVEPAERFTLADWLERAEALIGQLQSERKTPVVVGGTNLYLKALLEGMFSGPQLDAELRARLERLDSAELHRRLNRVDSEAAGRIHPNDCKRMIRALEVHHLTGQPISQWQAQWEPPAPQPTATSEGSGPSGVGGPAPQGSDPSGEGGSTPEGSDPSGNPSGIDGSTHEGSDPSSASSGRAGGTYRHNPILIGLHWPAVVLNKRINQRVAAMFHPEKTDPHVLEQLNIPESLPDEVRRLREQGMLGVQSSEAIGYKQVIEFMDGRCGLDEAFERTKIATRRLAKNQRTWLKRFRGVHWIDAAPRAGEQILGEACSIVSQCRIII